LISRERRGPARPPTPAAELEKATVYNSLAPETQQRLEKGNVSVGDTEDMVFVALDKPDAKRNITIADGPETVWVYKTYWEDYVDTGWVGWHRYYEPRGRSFAFYHERVPMALTRARGRRDSHHVQGRQSRLGRSSGDVSRSKKLGFECMGTCAEVQRVGPGAGGPSITLTIQQIVVEILSFPRLRFPPGTYPAERIAGGATFALNARILASWSECS
jgi:hypothetical protein